MHDHEHTRVNESPKHGDDGVPKAAAIESEGLPDPLTVKGMWIFHDRSGTDDGFRAEGYGPVAIPEGWEYLPRGDAFLTRRVKKGPHWILMGSYNRRRGYRPTKGVYAPATAIAEARAAAVDSAEKRKQSRERSRLRREKMEARCREEFEEACIQFLDFAPAHRELASHIAAETTEHACAKHSGRVGRTSGLDLAEKAALAVRAHIRHRFTCYDSLFPGGAHRDSGEKHDARAIAQPEVDRFLAEHRAPVSSGQMTGRSDGN